MLESTILRKFLVLILAIGLGSRIKGLPPPSLGFEHIDKNHDDSISVEELQFNWVEQLAADQAGRWKLFTNITGGISVLTPERAASQNLGSDFPKIDKNADKVASFSEVEEWVADTMATSQIWKQDKDKDGFLSRDEYFPRLGYP